MDALLCKWCWRSLALRFPSLSLSLPWPSSPSPSPCSSFISVPATWHRSNSWSSPAVLPGACRPERPPASPPGRHLFPCCSLSVGGEQPSNQGPRSQACVLIIWKQAVILWGKKKGRNPKVVGGLSDTAQLSGVIYVSRNPQLLTAVLTWNTPSASLQGFLCTVPRRHKRLGTSFEEPNEPIFPSHASMKIPGLIWHCSRVRRSHRP